MKLKTFTFVLLLFPVLAVAQSTQDMMEAGGISAKMEMAQVQAEQQKATIAKQLQAQASQGINILEGAVSGSEYVLGPNDMLTIILWGELSTTWNVAVTAEGRILLPNVGALDVAGKTLDDAVVLITEEVGQKYKNVEVTVSVALARTFKVHVTGNILQPGTYVANATERVSQLVVLAGGLLPDASRRNIVIKRNGLELTADLEGFIKAGNKAANPTVLDGDVILVPAKGDSISVWGEVAAEGYYEFREGDDLGDLIRLAGGAGTKAQMNEVKVLRFGADNVTTTELTVNAQAVLNGMESFRLQADDRVFIRAIPDYREQGMVAVNGEVKYPGMYPIVKGETKITEVIKMAGGFTGDANLFNATLQRDVSADSNNSEFQRITELPSAGATDLEYDYLRSQSREHDGVAIADFYRLFEKGEKKFDLVLQDKDVLTVPRSTNTVTVSGRVENPGQVAYVPGEGLHYYLKAAGGYGSGAKTSEVRVIKSGRGAWLKRWDVDEIGPEDVIWVPEKEEGYWWGRFKDGLTILSQIATLYLILK